MKMPNNILYYVQTPVEDVFTPSLDIAIQYAQYWDSHVWQYKLSNSVTLNTNKKHKERI